MRIHSPFPVHRKTHQPFPPASQPATPPRNTILVLSGGGGRGAAQLGVLHALADQTLEVDAVVGTSVGALNGSVVAAQTLKRAVVTLDEIWSSKFTQDLFRFDLRQLFLNRIHRNPSLHSNHTLTALIDHSLSALGVLTLEELPLPLYLLLTDLTVGKTLVVSSGPLRPPLIASCSAPGIFPPIYLDGHYFSDGGITENCSLGTAASLKPTHVIAIDLMKAGTLLKPLRRFSDTLDRVVQISTHAHTLDAYAQYKNQFPITLICTKPSPGVPLFSSLPELIASTYQAATKLLAKIQDPLTNLPAPGLYYLD